jgi:hypothetical protein
MDKKRTKQAKRKTKEFKQLRKFKNKNRRQSND